MKQLTIIIPMYNVVNYLKQCVSSITIKEIDYEILMVNDGSPDNSLQLAKELAYSNKRIRVLSQENKGLGGARNLGVENAKGKYIIFLDADDLLIENDFSFLANEEAEIIEYSSVNVSEGHQRLRDFRAIKTLSPLKGVDYCAKYPSMFSVCNKLYKLSFLQKNNLFFREHLFLEDFEFNSRAFFLAQQVISKAEVIQYFVQVNNSITRNPNKENKIKLVTDMVTIALLLQNFKKQFVLTTVELSYFNKRFTWLTVDVIYHTLKNNLGKTLLNKNLKILYSNGLFHLDYKLNHRTKDLFRIFLKSPLIINFIKFYYRLK